MPKTPSVKTSILVRGLVSIKLVDRFGREIVSSHDNLIVDSGLNLIAKLVAGTSVGNDRPSFIAVGTGGHAPGDITIPLPPTASDTSLETEISRMPVQDYTTPGGGIVNMTSIFQMEDAVGDITEAGLFSLGGEMLSRVTFSARSKTSALYMMIGWQYAFANGEE